MNSRQGLEMFQGLARQKKSIEERLASARQDYILMKIYAVGCVLVGFAALILLAVHHVK